MTPRSMLNTQSLNLSESKKVGSILTRYTAQALKLRRGQRRDWCPSRLSSGHRKKGIWHPGTVQHPSHLIQQNLSCLDHLLHMMPVTRPQSRNTCHAWGSQASSEWIGRHLRHSLDPEMTRVLGASGWQLSVPERLHRSVNHGSMRCSLGGGV